MIDITLSYGDLIIFFILFIIGSFIRGLATGLGLHIKKRKTDQSNSNTFDFRKKK